MIGALDLSVPFVHVYSLLSTIHGNIYIYCMILYTKNCRVKSVHSSFRSVYCRSLNLQSTYRCLMLAIPVYIWYSHRRWSTQSTSLSHPKAGSRDWSLGGSPRATGLLSGRLGGRWIGYLYNIYIYNRNTNHHQHHHHHQMLYHLVSLWYVFTINAWVFIMANRIAPRH